MIQAGLCPEDAEVRLHRLLHLASEFERGQRSGRGPDAVQDLDGIRSGVGPERLQRLARLELVPDRVRDGSTEDDEIQQGVGPQSVGAVHGHARGFAAGEETRDDVVLAVVVVVIIVDGDHLARVPGGDPAHVVVDRGDDRDRPPPHVDAGEDGGRLRDARKALG